MNFTEILNVLVLNSQSMGSSMLSARRVYAGQQNSPSVHCHCMVLCRNSAARRNFYRHEYISFPFPMDYSIYIPVRNPIQLVSCSLGMEFL